MPNILVNLPEGFFSSQPAAGLIQRLDSLGSVRRRSHNRPDEILEDLAWADAVLMWSWPVLDDALLSNATKLKAAAMLDISRAGAEAALKHGLPVSIGRSAFSPAVAEMALTLLLSCLRRASAFHHEMRQGIEPWVSRFPDEIDPLERELTGLTVGIVGFGRIGQRLAELLAPFRCPILAVDPYVPDPYLIHFGAERATISEAAQKADALVVCAASNEGTRQLLDREIIFSMKKDAVLVNVARAALADTPALIERLKRGDLIAALDVFDEEPLPKDHSLRSLPNAYLTPHRGGGINASVVRILDLLIGDLEGYFQGRPFTAPLGQSMISSLDS